MSDGISHLKRSVAANAPANCAPTNPGTSAGLMPEKVFVTERATVTAGLANEVDAVNQYAAVMYAPTAKGTAEGRVRTHPSITAISPKDAMNSLNTWLGPLLAWIEIEKQVKPNMKWAAATPAKVRANCARIYAGVSRQWTPLPWA